MYNTSIIGLWTPHKERVAVGYTTLMLRFCAQQNRFNTQHQHDDESASNTHTHTAQLLPAIGTGNRTAEMIISTISHVSVFHNTKTQKPIPEHFSLQDSGATTHARKPCASVLQPFLQSICVMLFPPSTVVPVQNIQPSRDLIANQLLTREREKIITHIHNTDTLPSHEKRTRMEVFPTVFNPFCTIFTATLQLPVRPSFSCDSFASLERLTIGLRSRG